MKPKIKRAIIDPEALVFDLQNEPMPRGAWWWWFWLFFFNNPKNPGKPRQLMILWSTKNVKEIDCNDLKINLTPNSNRSVLDGAVASWYFDGEKMHHNFLLEQCHININKSDNKLYTDSTTPTSFSIDKTKNIIKIGNDFEFIAEPKYKNKFTLPSYHSNNYISSRGYSIIRLNHLDLRGKVKGNNESDESDGNNEFTESIHGSAYFQRVFVSTPSPAWYWGIFHFENGGILTYFNPYVSKMSLKKDISFFDGKKLHEFVDITVKRTGGEIPIFIVSGENEDEKIKFMVNSYSHSSWTFRKKTLGIIPNKLIYNEYPAVISELELINKGTMKKIVLEDLGKSVGNAEHATGFLF